MSGKKATPSAEVTLAIDVTYCAKSKLIKGVTISPEHCVVEWDGVRVNSEGPPPAGKVTTVRKTINMLVSHHLWGKSDKPPDISYMAHILRGLRSEKSESNKEEPESEPAGGLDSLPSESVDESPQRDRGRSDLLNWIFGEEEGVARFLSLEGSTCENVRIVDSSVLKSTNTTILLRVNTDSKHEPASRGAMETICSGLTKDRFAGKWEDQSFEGPFTEIDPELKRRNEVRKRVIEILREHSDATDYLCDSFEGKTKRNPAAKEAVVADRLLDTPLLDFLTRIHNAHKLHSKQQNATAEVYREIATYVIPQLYDEPFRKSIRPSLERGGAFITVRASHRSLIEILVAGVDGRPAMFADEWQLNGPYPLGKLEIANNAEGGILLEDGIKTFIEEFEDALLQLVGDLPLEVEEKTRAIQEELSARLEDEPPVRFYYIYREGQLPIPELESRYKDIVFVVHERTRLRDSEGRSDPGYRSALTLKRLFCPESYQ